MPHPGYLPHQSLPFRVKALTEPRLQRLGLVLDQDLNLTLKLTNGVRTVESGRLPLLGV